MGLFDSLFGNKKKKAQELQELLHQKQEAERIRLEKLAETRRRQEEQVKQQRQTEEMRRQADARRREEERKRNDEKTAVKYGKYAEKVLNELRNLGALNTVAVMERAVKLYNDNSNVTSLSQVLNVIESLSLFVKAYQLDKEEHQNPGSVMKCKILMFIALCNYKIDNINRAYCIAKQGTDAIDEAINNSMFAGMPRSMYGQDTINELLEAIENTRHDEVVNRDDYKKIDPEEIDTTRFEEIARMIGSGAKNNQASNSTPTPINRDYILEVINKYDDLRGQLVLAAITGNKQVGFILKMMHEFVCPIFYAWEYWGYGRMSDLWKEDFAIESYQRFKEKDILQETRKSYSGISVSFPFKEMDKDGSLKAATMAIMENLIQALEK